MPGKQFRNNPKILSWIPEELIEEKARQQLVNIANLQFVTPYIAVMPDVHSGIGATIGSIIPMKDTIIPSAVGVDIGCGMIACKLPNISRPNLEAFGLKALQKAIENKIPIGVGKAHEKPWIVPPPDFYPKDYTDIDLANRQIGTLGSGNHFIELSQPKDSDDVWVVIHSGSRNFGLTTATNYIRKARELCRDKILVDIDLSYFDRDNPLFDSYISDCLIAQTYASLNRKTMLGLVIRAIREFISPPFLNPENIIESIHNYIELQDDLVIARKGAIRLNAGELGIIPGSMGTNTYIVEGLGNVVAFLSAPHGAGRRMSRSVAKKSISMRDFAKSVEGVTCNVEHKILDEAPAAYKDIEETMKFSSDLVRPITALKQFLCIKG